MCKENSSSVSAVDNINIDALERELEAIIQAGRDEIESTQGPELGNIFVD